MSSSLLFLDFVFPTLVVYGVWHARSTTFAAAMSVALFLIVAATAGEPSPSLGGTIIGGTRCFPTFVTTICLLIWPVLEKRTRASARMLFLCSFLVTIVIVPNILLHAYLNHTASLAINWSWAMIVGTYSCLINPAFAYWLIATDTIHDETRFGQTR